MNPCALHRGCLTVACQGRFGEWDGVGAWHGTSISLCPMTNDERDPLSVRPQLKDMLAGIVATVAVYALLIGAAFGLNGLALGGMVRTLLPVLIILALVIPTVALVAFMKRRGLPLGFRPLGRRGWHLLWQVPLAIVGAALCTSIVGPLLGVEPSSTSSTAGAGSALVLFTLAAYLLIGPFLEELVFRRLIMGYFDTLMPAAASVLLSSAIFGLAHIAPPAIIYTFFCGVAFALATRWHRSLWAGFIMHMANNVLVQLIVLAGI